MAITNAEAIRFQNEVVRVMAEKLRDVKIDIDLALRAWNGGINTLFPNDAKAESQIDDGRAKDGVSVLTGADVNNLMAQLAAIQTVLNGVGVADVIQKPCVRILSR